MKAGCSVAPSCESYEYVGVAGPAPYSQLCPGSALTIIWFLWLCGSVWRRFSFSPCAAPAGANGCAINQNFAIPTTEIYTGFFFFFFFFFFIFSAQNIASNLLSRKHGIIIFVVRIANADGSGAISKWEFLPRFFLFLQAKFVLLMRHQEVIKFKCMIAWISLVPAPSQWCGTVSSLLLLQLLYSWASHVRHCSSFLHPCPVLYSCSL